MCGDHGYLFARDVLNYVGDRHGRGSVAAPYADTHFMTAMCAPPSFSPLETRGPFSESVLNTHYRPGKLSRNYNTFLYTHPLPEQNNTPYTCYSLKRSSIQVRLPPTLFALASSQDIPRWNGTAILIAGSHTVDPCALNLWEGCPYHLHSCSSCSLFSHLLVPLGLALSLFRSLLFSTQETPEPRGKLLSTLLDCNWSTSMTDRDVHMIVSSAQRMIASWLTAHTTVDYRTMHPVQFV